MMGNLFIGHRLHGLQGQTETIQGGELLPIDCEVVGSLPLFMLAYTSVPLTPLYDAGIYKGALTANITEF